MIRAPSVLARLACAFVLAGPVACSGDDADADGKGPDGGAGPETGATADAGAAPVDLEALDDRLLSELSAAEAHAVCEAGAERVDLCLMLGRAEQDPQACEQRVEECRELDPAPAMDCSGAAYDGLVDCPVPVGDYLACLDSWSEALSCSDLTTAARKQCVGLLEACPHFAIVFGPASSYVAPCDLEVAPPRQDEDDDIVGVDGCRPVPARMVSIGDSIAACAGTEVTGEACAPDLIAQALRESHAPDLEYEQLAVFGAVTADAVGQAQRVEPGEGHVLVWAFVGGNDLASCQDPDMAVAVACVDDLLGSLPSQWDDIYAHFTDPARFPDGVTFILNTQYSLFDQCDHPLGPLRLQSAEQNIQRYNTEVLLARATARADTVALDHYPDWLGHANSADHEGCPHCYADPEDNASWLFDHTHPNGLGNQALADKAQLALDMLYRGDCAD